jgi:uncharacterized membrane protein YphA (DoxX/SURF4 family)
MSFDLAVRLTEILLAFAFIQQSMEHLYASKQDRYIFIIRLILCLGLFIGFATQWICLALALNTLFMLHRFQGPYNGGSDRMGILILFTLCFVHFLPNREWQYLAFGYLAIQLILSYFIAGWVKFKNREWRSGRALQDVFQFSAYPVSESLRGWADKPRLLFIMSWAVIIFEMMFPLMLLTQTTLIIGLGIATIFHFANACLFGFNRFFWVWITAYPSLFWLQSHVL